MSSRPELLHRLVHRELSTLYAGVRLSEHEETLLLRRSGSGLPGIRSINVIEPAGVCTVCMVSNTVCMYADAVGRNSLTWHAAIRERVEHPWRMLERP